MPNTTTTDLGRRPGRRWRLLTLLATYRVLLSALLALVYFFYPDSHQYFGQREPLLFALVSLLYFASTVIAALLVTLRQPAFHHQVYLMIFSDIVAIVLLMHASGGIGSGIGMLLLISLAISTTLIDTRAALTFAALAAVSVLAEQLYAVLYLDAPTSGYVQAGLFGIAVFAIAVLASNLSQRLKSSEYLAHQRGAELARLSELNNYIIQHMQAGLAVVDDNSVLRMANEAAWQLLDMPVAPPRAPLEEISPALARALNHWREQRGSIDNLDVNLPGERQLNLQFTRIGLAEHQGIMLLIKDSGEVNRQATRMKLASLGKLTASIAHEIRNPLGAIGHAAQLLGESPELNDADRRLTQIIHDNTERVNRVIEDVLGLSRRTQATFEALRLADWLDKLITDNQAGLGLGDKRWRIAITPKNTRVIADPSQLAQIVINIVRNAVVHGGQPMESLKITLCGGLTRESKNPVLDIIDNGNGIPPDTVNRIFEPFFTTRNSGTGLGLYIVRELAELNDIDLRYIPPPTGGSCFRLTFKGRL